LLDRETLLNEVMSSVEELVSDSSNHVRAALGTQLSGLAPILGKEEFVHPNSRILSRLTYPN
jgi:serine/threonine-protein phosphatase 2A regulatory subunit A